MPSHKSLRRLILGATVCLAATLTSPLGTAQGTPGAGIGSQGPVGANPLVVPATPFQWSATLGTGAVKVPFPGMYGWFVVQGAGLEARVVPSLSGDPTIETIFFPVASGHPTKAERVTIQFPYNPASIPGSGALVIAFHSYGVSEKDIWVNTLLPQICKERGWMLIAPFGLVDTHYGNVPSQVSLDKVLKTFGTYFKWDPKRVYTVGFSMGGGAALSYSMRHLTDSRLQVAGVVNHTGTQDLLEVYNKGSIAVKQMLVNNSHFFGPPTTEDGFFAYRRVSPAIFTGGVVDPALTPVRNLAHLPIYTFVNANDPQTDLVADNLAVSAYLQGLGFNVNQVTGNQAPLHKWSTMDLDAALTWIAGYQLPAKPTAGTIFADIEAPYFGTKVRAKPAKRVAYYEFSSDVPTNSFKLKNTLLLDSLVLDLDALGLNRDLVVGGSWSSQDALGDELVLSGYRTAPTQVLLNGIPSSTWSFDALARELTIPIPAGPTSGVLLITP